jgi:small subunit ribosomal protein S17
MKENHLSVANNRKSMSGTVVSDKMDKTVVIVVERKFSHPKFKKVVKTTRRFKVHDEKNECRSGDLITISETRPLSKDKRWRLSGIIKKARVEEKVETK